MKLRILHLEDIAMDADLVRASLSRAGLNCDILPVNCGDAFLAALQRPELDVILSDSGVPGYDGRDALAAGMQQLVSVVQRLSLARDLAPIGTIGVYWARHHRASNELGTACVLPA